MLIFVSVCHKNRRIWCPPCVCVDRGTGLIGAENHAVEVKDGLLLLKLIEKDGYTVFIDGKQHGQKVGNQGDEAVSSAEDLILLTTEAKWYRNNKMKGKPVAELKDALGDEFLVDFVRVYDEVK